jgi:hypothetical protein
MNGRRSKPRSLLDARFSLSPGFKAVSGQLSAFSQKKDVQAER